MRCGTGAERAGLAFANGRVRFRASRRRSSERVPPVRRASSGSRSSERENEKRLAVRGPGGGPGNDMRRVTEVPVGASWVRRPGLEA